MKPRIVVLSVLLILSLSTTLTVRGQQFEISLLKRFDGVSPSSNLGLSVAFVGDVDLDGTSDILVGASGASPNGVSLAGSAFLYSGATFTQLHEFDGVSTGEDFGVSVAGAGDVNRDGVPDLLIGADYGGNRTSAPGSVFIYSGRDYSQLGRVSGVAVGDLFGTSVASLGDVTGDGRPDFAVGAIGFSPNTTRTGAGAVYIYSGTLSTTPLKRIDGDASHDSFGISVAAVGDVNRDRISDLLVGADLADPGGRVNAGSAYVFSGSGFSLLHRFDGFSPGDSFGTSVAGVGDINGDGIPDFLIGAPAASPAGLTYAGSAYLYSGLGFSLLHQFDGGSVADDFGWSLSGVGDLNNDGTPDFIIGADLADPSGNVDAGSVYIYSGIAYTVLSQIDGQVSGDNMGWSTAGDGRGHILVGAPFTSPSGLSEAGSAYLYTSLSFGISVSPSSTAILIGSTNASIVTLTSFGTFTGNVSLSASIAPLGLGVSFNQTTVALSVGGTGGAKVTFDSSQAPGSMYTVRITGTISSGEAHTATIAVAVEDFSMSSNPKMLILSPGSSQDVAIGVTSLAGFSDSVNLGATVSPAGPTAFLTPSLVVLPAGGTTSSTLTVSATASIPLGNYNVTVTGSASSLVRNTTITVIVGTNAPPMTAFTYSPQQPTVNDLVTFDASGTSDPDDTVSSYQWILGDGSTGIGVIISHSYLSSGKFHVTLRAVDSRGGSSSLSQDVSVSPALNLGATATPTGGTGPLSVDFKAAPTGGVGPYTFLWVFGDGNTATGQSPTHTYDSAGTYQAAVHVTDSAGHTTTFDMTITVTQQPPSMIGPLPAVYLLYGLVASLVALGVVGALFVSRGRRPEP